MDQKNYKLLINLEVIATGTYSLDNVNHILKMLKQTIMQETNNQAKIRYSNIEILGIDGGDGE